MPESFLSGTFLPWYESCQRRQYAVCEKARFPFILIPNKNKTIFAARIAPYIVGALANSSPLFAAGSASSGTILTCKSLSTFYRVSVLHARENRAFLVYAFFHCAIRAFNKVPILRPSGGIRIDVFPYFTVVVFIADHMLVK